MDQAGYDQRLYGWDGMDGWMDVMMDGWTDERKESTYHCCTSFSVTVERQRKKSQFEMSADSKTNTDWATIPYRSDLNSDQWNHYF